MRWADGTPGTDAGWVTLWVERLLPRIILSIPEDILTCKSDPMWVLECSPGLSELTDAEFWCLLVLGKWELSAL